MASRSTKGRDGPLETSRTAPTGRPSPNGPNTTDPSASSTKYGTRWVNPGPPPKLVDLPEEQIQISAKCRNISEADYPQWRLEFMKELAERDAKRAPPIGMKRERGGPGVFRINIPGTTLLIRLWDGGAERMGQYLLDYYDYEDLTPVNTPPGWKMYPENRRGAAPYMSADGTMVSLEKAFGHPPETMPFGVEKFMVLEGSRWRLQRPGVKKDLLFAVPCRRTPEEYESFEPFDEV